MDLLLLIFCCSCSMLLSDAEPPTIIYPFISTCAVKGSTVTLPCTFTPKTSFIDQNKIIPLKIVRVVWCRGHEICQGTTETVYDSQKTQIAGYEYLGDMKSNCTLQIRNVPFYPGNGTFRFRMEANDSAGHFTNRTGVFVKVSDRVQMEVSRSGNHSEVRGGGNVTLRCSSECSTHQLKVTWFRDNHSLSESGHALQLGPLTAEDSGDYTCELKNRGNTKSAPYSLKVEGVEGRNLPLVAAVTCGVLALMAAVASVVFIRRKRAAGEGSRAERVDTRGDEEEVNYASVNFKHKKKQDRKTKEDKDAVIYSSVSRRS